MSGLQPENLQKVRRILGGIFLLGTLGTGAELFLIEHTEDAWQWIPLILLAAGVLLLLSSRIVRTGSIIQIFRFTMILSILSGMIGIGLHYQAKVEFKLEINPALKGIELIQEAIKGASLPPILAPGMMIHLGMIGLVYTFLHPSVQKKKKESL